MPKKKRMGGNAMKQERAELPPDLVLTEEQMSAALLVLRVFAANPEKHFPHLFPNVREILFSHPCCRLEK